jgi:hypothetical protein
MLNLRACAVDASAISGHGVNDFTLMKTIKSKRYVFWLIVIQSDYSYQITTKSYV